MLGLMRQISTFFIWLIQNLVNLIWSHEILRWSFSIFILSIVAGIIVRFALGLKGGKDSK